jgi:hypothetical protein
MFPVELELGKGREEVVRNGIGEKAMSLGWNKLG